MADQASKVGGHSPRINIGRADEVRAWSAKFGVSADQLRAGVKAVGADAKAVEAHLKREQRLSQRIAK
jgi:hypothetical protein